MLTGTIIAGARGELVMWKTLVRAAIALTALQVAGLSLASPYTVYFSGTTTYYYDYVTGAEVLGNEGQPFSGWLTFDLANAQSIVDYDSAGVDYAYSFADSYRGCYSREGVVCAPGDDYGASAPLVTGYSISTPFAPPGGYQPMSLSTYVYDYSTIQNFRCYPGSCPTDGYDQYTAYRNQYQQSYTGDLSGSYQYAYVERYFGLSPIAYDNLMFALVSDLLGTPNLANVDSGQFNIRFQSDARIADCLFGGDCTFGDFFPNSLVWEGTLASLRVVEGPANVPEPATLALAGLALAGLGFSRRKKA